MLRSFLTILSFVLLGALSAPDAFAQNWADKMFKTNFHDFRTVGRGAKAEYRFELTNPYKEDVHIAAVRSSCGCTTPVITKQTLKTHETGAIIAIFNTNTFIGKKGSTFTVVFDKPFYAEAQLKVTGFIRTDITFDPPEVGFGEFPIGEPQQQEVVITHTGNTNWRITDVRSHCPNLQVRLNPPELSPGVVRYRMQVTTNGELAEGEIHERLTLVSNDSQFPTTEMAVSGRARAAVSVAPASIDLGTSSADADIERRLVVKGDQEFEIKEVVCADKRFEFEVPVGSKKLHFVKLRFKGDGTASQVSQEIQIITNLPGDQSATCLVTGTLQ